MVPKGSRRSLPATEPGPRLEVRATDKSSESMHDFEELDLTLLAIVHDVYVHHTLPSTR